MSDRFADDASRNVLVPRQRRLGHREFPPGDEVLLEPHPATPLFAFPGHSYYSDNMNQRQQHKRETRRKIVQSAVRYLKTEGLSGASVSDIMAEAGLTVGGFYAHFPSKDALAQEALRSAVAERRRMFLDHFDGLTWSERAGCGIDGYFTKEHRDDPANGCPLPMAALEAAHNQAMSPAFIDEFARFAEAMQKGEDLDSPPAPREAALGTLALMVGGMILARAAKGHAVSDEILVAARAFGETAVQGFAKQPTGPASQERRER